MSDPFHRLPPDQRLGDAPLEAKYRDMLLGIAGALDRVFNGEAKGAAKKIGFVLMLFEYGDHSGRCNYVSNGADRNDVVTLMKEMIARFEAP